MNGHSDRADADIRRFAPKWARSFEGVSGRGWFPRGEPANQNIDRQHETGQAASRLWTSDAAVPVATAHPTDEAERAPLDLEDGVPLPSIALAPRSGVGIFGLLGVMILAATVGTAGALLLIRRTPAPPAAEAPPATSAPAALRAPTLVTGAAPSPGTVDPLPLGIGVTDAPGSTTVVIGGLPQGAMLSKGTSLAPGGWQVPVTDLPTTVIRPPPGFAGAMDLAVELRLADDSVVDRSSVRREWTGVAPVAIAAPNGPAAPAPSGYTAHQLRGPTRHLPPEEIESFLARGQRLMQNGDIASARLLFQRAAEAHDPRAALAIGATYDPFTLRKLGIHGLTSDIALARSWYETARDLGSSDAQERLNALASQDPH